MTKYTKTGEANGASKQDLAEEKKALKNQMEVLKNSMREAHTLDDGICPGKEFKKDPLKTDKNYGNHPEDTDGPRDD